MHVQAEILAISISLLLQHIDSNTAKTLFRMSDQIISDIHLTSASSRYIFH